MNRFVRSQKNVVSPWRGRGDAAVPIRWKGWWACLLLVPVGCSEFRPAPPAPTEAPIDLEPHKPPVSEAEEPASSVEVGPGEDNMQSESAVFGLPCSTHEDCDSASAAGGGYCLSMVPGAGTTCTLACVDGCPEGYGCESVAPLSGGEALFLCLAESESVCDEGGPLEATPCFKENEHGQCSGVETCTLAGGWTCDAELPAPEFCDGVDNNCNGSIDEGCSPTVVRLEQSAAVVRHTLTNGVRVHLSVAPVGVVGDFIGASDSARIHAGFYPALTSGGQPE